MSEKFMYGKAIISLTVDTYMARPLAKILHNHFGYDFTTVECSGTITVHGPVDHDSSVLAVAKWNAFAVGVLKAWIEPITKFM